MGSWTGGGEPRRNGGGRKCSRSGKRGDGKWQDAGEIAKKLHNIGRIILGANNNGVGTGIEQYRTQEV